MTLFTVVLSLFLLFNCLLLTGLDGGIERLGHARRPSGVRRAAQDAGLQVGGRHLHQRARSGPINHESGGLVLIYFAFVEVEVVVVDVQSC